MDILFETLKELNYEAQDSFSFKYIVEEIESDCCVLPFSSCVCPSQTYLVISINSEELQYILKSKFLPNLAATFRKQNFHKSDMDRNTTLLLRCCCDDSSTDIHLHKMQIEDDPYYFKKYVFVYSSLEEKRANEYMSAMIGATGINCSLVDAIQSYLADTDRFTSYKENHVNQPTYSYLVELATKIPALPLPSNNEKTIKSVDAFLEEELMGTETDIDALNKLLDLNLDFKDDSTETILTCWEKCINQNVN